MSYENPSIEIRTGSDSDIPKIRQAYEFLESLSIPYSPRILSAHRTPEVMTKEAQALSENGFRVSIAAAGGSAHLPGMTASETLVPVLGIPVKGSNLDGQDSLYSIIQMPNGVPVGTVGIGQAKSAAILAAQISFLNNSEVRNRIRKARGLAENLPSELEIKPIVGIIKSESTALNESKYAEMQSLLKDLGLSTEEFSLSENLEAIDQKDLVALIVLQEAENKEASLPGEIANQTDLPVIGLPISSSPARSTALENDIFEHMLTTKEGEGYPVAGMGINRYLNAGLFAAQIAGLFIANVQGKIQAYKLSLKETVREKDERLQKEGVKSFIK